MRLRLLPFLALLALAGCSSRPADTASGTAVGPTPNTGATPSVTGFPRTVTDARGKAITLATPPQRIVSLAPSNTEDLFALGAGNRIAGDTTACDYPPEAKAKPHIGGAGMSLESILAQNPDLVVTVGAINKNIVDALETRHVTTLVVNPKTVADVYDSLVLLGKATGQDKQAEKLVADMKLRIDAVKAKTQTAANHPKVLIMYGDSPIYTTGPGSFISDLIPVAGGTNIVDAPLPNDIISNEQVLQRQPDVIICGTYLETKVKTLPGWASAVPAVRNNRFFNESAQATLIRPTPRLAQGVEELAAYLHPELFPKK